MVSGRKAMDRKCSRVYYVSRKLIFLRRELEKRFKLQQRYQEKRNKIKRWVIFYDGEPSTFTSDAAEDPLSSYSWRRTLSSCLVRFVRRRGELPSARNGLDMTPNTNFWDSENQVRTPDWPLLRKSWKKRTTMYARHAMLVREIAMKIAPIKTITRLATLREGQEAKC